MESPPAPRRWGHEPSYADVIKSWFYSNLVTHDRSLWQVESINNKKTLKILRRLVFARQQLDALLQLLIVSACLSKKGNEKINLFTIQRCKTMCFVRVLNSQITHLVPRATLTTSRTVYLRLSRNSFSSVICNVFVVVVVVFFFLPADQVTRIIYFS